MKIDPPTNGSTPAAAPQPPRPRGKVFDVMAPGRAPANPSSRPVLIGHKPEAQQAQASVSGVGAPEPRDNLRTHIMTTIQPAHDIDAGQSTPKVPVVHYAGNAEQPAHNPQQQETFPDPEPAQQATVSTDVPAPAEPAERQQPEAPQSPAASTNDALAAVAMEPEAPAPPPEPASQQSAPPVPEPDSNDPIHDAVAPSLEHQVVVSHHSTAPSSSWKLVLLIVLAVLFAVLVLDILLDAGVISSSAIPHTHLF